MFENTEQDSPKNVYVLVVTVTMQRICGKSAPQKLG